jgi:hypothetical protein
MINLVSVGVCRGDSFAERMVSSSKVEIEKFNGLNFELWKLKMKDILVDKEQWAFVDQVQSLFLCRQKIGKS